VRSCGAISQPARSTAERALSVSDRAQFVSLEQALDHSAAAGLVAFPTETVWGLAACAEDPLAVARLQAFKGRGADQPISLLIDQPGTLKALGFELTASVRAVIDAFWPGPLTIILAASAPTPFASGIAGANGAVGFRCSDHPLCAAFVRSAFDRGLGPVTATSFNRTGETPVQTRAEALRLGRSPEAEHVRCLDPGPHDALAEAPSTVLDLSSERPRVLRWGAIRDAALTRVLERFEGVRASQ